MWACCLIVTTGTIRDALSRDYAVSPRRLIGHELERRPPVVSSAPAGGAVEITGGIENQRGLGSVPVRAVAEAIQHLLRPASARCGRQLEYRPRAVSAARDGRAVEIAGGIEDQAGRGARLRPDCS